VLELDVSGTSDAVQAGQDGMRKIPHPSLEYGRTEGEGYLGAFLIPGPCGDRLSIICSDGSDWEACGLEGEPWEHVSVKATDGRKGWRTPNWKEMSFIKDLFWNEDECVVQYHPAKSDYVNHHAAVLHLWRCKAGFPMPPRICV